jgi:hypothetical protein
LPEADLGHFLAFLIEKFGTFVDAFIAMDHIGNGKLSFREFADAVIGDLRYTHSREV